MISSYIHDISDRIREKVHYMGMIGDIWSPPPGPPYGLQWQDPFSKDLFSQYTSIVKGGRIS